MIQCSHCGYIMLVTESHDCLSVLAARIENLQEQVAQLGLLYDSLTSHLKGGTR